MYFNCKNLYLTVILQLSEDYLSDKCNLQSNIMIQFYENYYLVKYNSLKPMQIPAMFSRKIFKYIIVISLFRNDFAFLRY